jgi:ABC-type dipeptide/oligopeptide/nickel transport system permease component
VVASVPRFVLVLLACMIYGSDPLVLATAAGASYAPGLGQAVYARLEALRGAEFVLAARAHGLSDARILGRHLLWVNCRRLVGRHHPLPLRLLPHPRDHAAPTSADSGSRSRSPRGATCSRSSSASTA